MQGAAILSALGLFLTLAGCSLSSQCRSAGPQGSAAFQACVSAILQQQSQLQNWRDQNDWAGSDG